MTDKDRKDLKDETLKQLEKEKFINLSESSRKIIDHALEILLDNLTASKKGDVK